MPLRLYSTLTRQKEDFLPADPERVLMYVCGPTTYDYCHVGHARAYIAFDVIRRYLRYAGYRVRYVSNITNVDDRIIQRAAVAGEDPTNLAERFTRFYFEDLKSIGVAPADVHPLVTDTIPEIIGMIRVLEEKEVAYASNGSVYFRVASAEHFGELSHQDRDALEAGARVEVDPDKHDPQDFALWKAAKPGEISWPSPWGAGRPGWHIECSAMSMKHLGPRIDLHGGGIDLVFPHHECEILQSEAHSGQRPFVRYWVHNGHLTRDNEKMSKSLGNFFTIREVLAKFPAPVLRFFFLNTQYRRPLDFSDSALAESRASLERLQTTVDSLEEAARRGSRGGGTIAAEAATARSAFRSAMDDDFQTREALAAMFTFARQVNERIDTLSGAAVLEALGLFTAWGDVLGLPFGGTPREMPAEAQRILEDRELARAAKDYATADALREKLTALGFVIQDTKDGPRWRALR